MDFAREGSGPVVVLIPGLGCDHRLWQPVGRRLARQYTVVYPQTWGTGSIRAAAEGVVSVLDAVGARKAAVAGLSMGGYVTFELLRHHPGRLWAAALVDTTPFGDTPERRSKRDQVLRLIERGEFDTVLGTYAESVLAPHNARGPLRDLLVNMGRAVGPEAFARDVAAIRDRGDYEDVLTSIRVPALFVSGELDKLTPPEVARRAAERVPGARVAVIPGAAHMTPIEAPQELARILSDFLDQTAPGAENREP